MFAPLSGRINFPGHSLTLIVKGTFDLVANMKAEPSAEPLYPTGDEFFPDDVDMTGAPRYESDFAYYKPCADLLLAGHCHCPGGKPIPACPVTFRVGPVSRTLYVFGDRFWKTIAGLRTITEPEPFTKMELRYENSFGGVGFKNNPIGKGAGAEESDKGKTWPLPNIEDPQDLIDSPGKKPEPAGFGSMGRMWEQRYSKMGSYSGSYLKDRWPWFAEDFDYGYFNAAPAGMQMEGYLRGDEALYFENLHPEHQRYESSLPGIRVRCFLNRGSGADGNGADFREVSIRLDTLWADMDAEKLVLVWRGVTEIASEDYEEEIEHIFIMSESLDQESESLIRCHELFLAALAEEDEERVMEPEEPPEEEQEVKAEAPKVTEPEIPGDELKKQIEAQTGILLAKMGIDLNSLPPSERQKAKKEQDRIIERITQSDPDKMAAVEEKEIQEQLSGALEKAGIDAKNLPGLSDKAKAEQMRLFKELGMDDPAIMQDPEIAGFMGILGALMPKMGIDPEDLTPVIEAAKKQLVLPQTADEEVEQPSALTREIVAERSSRGESFTGENLSGLDLKGLDLKDLDFSGADLSGADLSGAVLDRAVLAGADLSDANLEKEHMEEADLTGATLSKARLTGAMCIGSTFTGSNLVSADLSGADLSGAVLEEADLTGANMEKAMLIEADATGAKFTDARMTGTNLSEAIFEQAEMANAIMEDVIARDAYFAEADLSGAKLSGSDFSKADFSGATLNGADFKNSVLAEASVEGATCMNGDFTGADLTKLRASEGGNFSNSTFIKANGFESIWHDAILDGADFSFSKMQGSDFTKASLKQANMAAADMKQARFMKADLNHARLVVMNLFECSMEKANLTGADLSGSNMYGAEFLDAIIDKTIFERTNLKMTKLA